MENGKGGSQNYYKKPGRLTGYPSAKMEKAKMKQKHDKLSKKLAVSRTSVRTGHNCSPMHSPLQDTVQIMNSYAQHCVQTLQLYSLFRMCSLCVIILLQFAYSIILVGKGHNNVKQKKPVKF